MSLLRTLILLLSLCLSLAHHQVTHVRGSNRRNEAVIWCFVTARPPMKLSWKMDHHKILSVNVPENLPDMEREWSIVQAGKLYPKKDFVRLPGKFYGMLKKRRNDYAFALVIPTAAPGLRRTGNFVCEVGNSPPVSNKTLSFGHPPTLVPERQLLANNSDNFALPGSAFALNCPFEGDPLPEVSWTTPKGAKNGVLYEEAGQKLRILSVKAYHLGEYQCMSKNSHGEKGMRFFLKSGEPPKLLDISKYDKTLESFVEHLVAPLNKKITLNCPVSGKPQPKICWYRRDSKRLKHTSQSIRIRAPKNRNSTFFSCFATNQFGHTEKMFHIFKEGQIPIFQRSEVNRNVAVRMGQEIILDCATFGAPVPGVSWFKDGQEIAQKKDVLRIFPARMQDSGIYRCKGGNIHGFLSRTFRVFVKPL
ncbi:hemicentin-1-like [Phlebotomus argentipes]|uniref:hemicentin-1-like n=1 Tax=Phlebotomus argentipes TaxID=94469 RepID=UPI0028937300|nr:hemicentin-1-like [Phlebotomus argentipes]